jgi:hypothetical protein
MEKEYMPRKKQVNADKLIEAVESGLPSTKIMDKFGIKTSAQLKALYLDALVEKGKAPGIKTRAGRAPKKSKEIFVNKRGSLIVPRELVEEMGFKEEDEFSITKTKSGISLKRK